MTTTIRFESRNNLNILTDVTSVVLSNNGATYGVKNSTTDAIVIAANTALTHDGTGLYSYTFSDPSPSAVYDYVLKIVANGVTNYLPAQISSGLQPTTSSSTDFTSEAEIERLLSAQGVDNRVDDAGDSDDRSEIIAEVINDATEQIQAYTWGQYTNLSLSTSTWVRRRATFIAAHLLSQRRGNPSPFTERVEKIIQELQMVNARALSIPNVVGVESSTPALSNYIINNNGVAPVCRVDAPNSVGTYPGQKKDFLSPY